MDRLEQLFRALATREGEGEGGGGGDASDRPKVLDEVSVDGIVKHILQISGSSHRKFVRRVFLFVYTLTAGENISLLAPCREEDLGDDRCRDINLYVLVFAVERGAL